MERDQRNTRTDKCLLRLGTDDDDSDDGNTSNLVQSSLHEIDDSAICSATAVSTTPATATSLVETDHSWSSSAGLLQNSNIAVTRSATEKPPSTKEEQLPINNFIRRILMLVFECLVVTGFRLVSFSESNLYHRLLRSDIPPNEEDVEDDEVECCDYMNADYFHPGSIVGSGTGVTNIVVNLKEESLQVLDAAPRILSLDMMKQLVDCFGGSSISIKRWKRLYSVARDGDSFASFLNNVHNEKDTLVVVKTMDDDTVFGAYVNTEWREQARVSSSPRATTSAGEHGMISASSSLFYGTGQSFLFSFNEDQELSVYKWTGLNNYNQLCVGRGSGGMIALGGGGHDANFGLCIEDCFRRGSSGHCETYNNAPLAGIDKEFFDVLAFEVYGFENML